MTVQQLVQLYAPLAGLLAVVFWLGVLSERVRRLREDVTSLEQSDAATKDGERLVRLETKMEGVKECLESTDRQLAGIHRQLANIASGRAKIHVFDSDGEP
jgi:hypothetical protein